MRVTIPIRLYRLQESLQAAQVKLLGIQQLQQQVVKIMGEIFPVLAGAHLFFDLDDPQNAVLHQKFGDVAVVRPRSLLLDIHIGG